MSAQIIESPEEMSQRPFTQPVTPSRVLPLNRSQLQQCTLTQSRTVEPTGHSKGSAVLSAAQGASPENHASTTMWEVPEACTMKACQLLGPQPEQEQRAAQPFTWPIAGPVAVPMVKEAMLVPSAQGVMIAETLWLGVELVGHVLVAGSQRVVVPTG